MGQRDLKNVGPPNAHAANLIMENPAALQDSRLGHIYIFSFIPQLRYMQTLNSIYAENNSTIPLPVLVDILSSGLSDDKALHNIIHLFYC